MNDDIFQSIPQGGDRTKDSENSRITAIANKLEGLCAVYEAQLRDGSQHVNRLDNLSPLPSPPPWEGFFMPHSDDSEAFFHLSLRIFLFSLLLF